MHDRTRMTFCPQYFHEGLFYEGAFCNTSRSKNISLDSLYCSYDFEVFAGQPLVEKPLVEVPIYAYCECGWTPNPQFKKVQNDSL